jgi:hypothetical protein
MGHSAEVKTTKNRPVLMKADVALSEAFPEIVNGFEYPYATGGDWSTHDLIFYLLGKIGPASLVAATWSVSEAAAIKLASALDSGLITDISFLVDWRVQVRTPSFLSVAREKFADVRVSSCHAKAFVLRNENWAISVVGSANFTNNPRIEAGHMSTNAKAADFHAGWILAEIKNAQPFGLDMRKRGRADGRA